MDVVVAAAVGGNGYFWVHYLTPAAAAVGAVPEVVGAEAVSVAEVSVGVAAVDSAVDSAVALAEAAALVAAAPAGVGKFCPSYSESGNSVSIRDTQT